jgi:hypothetical protein
LLNDFPKGHRKTKEQKHKLAAQHSRLQRNATIHPAKSVAAEAVEQKLNHPRRSISFCLEIEVIGNLSDS